MKLVRLKSSTTGEHALTALETSCSNSRSGAPVKSPLMRKTIVEPTLSHSTCADVRRLTCAAIATSCSGKYRIRPIALLAYRLANLEGSCAVRYSHSRPQCCIHPGARETAPLKKSK